MKQDIAAQLRENGMPPQDVKKFLETLDTEQSASSFKNFTLNTKNKEQDNILDHVVLKDKQQWGDGGLQDKVIGMLKKDQTLQNKGSNKNWFQEQGDTKHNIPDQIKVAGQKIKMDFLSQATSLKNDSPLEGIVQKLKGSNSEKTVDPIKEGIGTATLGLHPDVAHQRIRGGVERALSNLGKYRPYELDKPYTLVLKLKEMGAGPITLAERSGPGDTTANIMEKKGVQLNGLSSGYGTTLRSQSS